MTVVHTCTIVQPLQTYGHAVHCKIGHTVPCMFGHTVWPCSVPPMSQKFCADPKTGAHNFCGFKSVDLWIFWETFTESTVFELQKSYVPLLGLTQNFWLLGGMEYGHTCTVQYYQFWSVQHGHMFGAAVWLLSTERVLSTAGGTIQHVQRYLYSTGKVQDSCTFSNNVVYGCMALWGYGHSLVKD
jgi:hypothetical protein